MEKPPASMLKALGAWVSLLDNADSMEARRGPLTHRQIAGVSPITPEKSAERKKENTKRKQRAKQRRKRK